MQDPATLDEIDLAVVHAVQIAPRAPWSEIAGAVGVDAATAARRWTALEATGAVWLAADPGTPRPGRLSVAIIEIDCVADQLMPAATALARDPRVASIEHVTGSGDLFLTVFTAGLGALSDFLLHGLSTVPGVRATRSHVANRIFTEGSKWRLRALDPTQRRRIRSFEPRPKTAPAPLADVEVRTLMHTLASNPRMSITELADRMELSRPTARRRLDTALANTQIVMRCDISQAVSGWPVSATFWTSVPPEEHADAAHALAGIPETRLTAGLTGGPANLLLTMWLRSLDDVHRLESVLAERLPRLRVINRTVGLRQIKRIGRILTPDGRATTDVRLDPWYSHTTPDE